MKNETYVPADVENPDLDGSGYRLFRAHFQKSVLLSLFERNLLTRAQYECCVEKVERKYSKPPLR